MRSIAILGIFCLVILNCGAQNWKSIKRIRTNALKDAHDRNVLPQNFDQKLFKYGGDKKDEAHFVRILRQLLKVRVPGTDGSRQVRQSIENEMRSLGWTVEEDQFRQNTVIGNVEFTNVIATLDPNAPRRMVLACHYDSKVTPRGFLGATDSAVPCAQMINLAHTLKNELDATKNQKALTLQFIFFDGEEAFKSWTSTDSIYGSRHLAAIWKNTPYEFRGVQGNTLDRIDIFMLLDLLGARNPNINSSQRPTEPWFKRLMQIEDGITEKRIFPSRLRKIFKQTAFPSSVEDDHKPFEKQGVPILHVISTPFPDVWHTEDDDASAVHLPTVEKLNMIFRAFVADYLNLP